MALYPYTITAIAKNTNETSNIVPGAMVSLLDSNGNAVVMYDDAAGSNGSTGKVADTRGQVTVYVEQGEYSLNVNGTANGKFVVSSSEKQTTQELINSARTYQTGDTITTSGFTAAGDGGGAQWLATATTGQTPSQTPAQLGNAELTDGNGRKWALQVNGPMNAKSFGLVGVGDETVTLQSIANWLDENKSVYFEDDFAITSTVTFNNGGTVDFGSVKIDGTGVPSSTSDRTLNQALVFTGSLNSSSSIDADISAGDSTFESASASLSVGDTVIVRSNQLFVDGWTGSTNNKRGEILTISGVTGSMFTVSERFKFSYTQSDNLRVEKMNPTSVLIKGGVLQMGGVGSEHRGLQLIYARNAIIDGLVVKGAEDSSVSIEYSHTISYKGECWDATTPNSGFNTGYGVASINGSRNIDIDIVGRNCKHVVTGGGFLPSLETRVKGVAYDSGLTTTAFDCHEPCFGWDWNIECYGGHAGIGLRGSGQTVKIKAENLDSNAVRIKTFDNPGLQYDIDVDLHSKNTGSTAVLVESSSCPIDGIFIKAKVSDTDVNGVLILGNATNGVSNIRLDADVDTSASRAFDLRYVTDCNGVIRCRDSGEIGAQCFDSSNVNLSVDVESNTNYGVYYLRCNDSSVSGSKSYSGSTYAIFTDDCSNIKVTVDNLESVGATSDGWRAVDTVGGKLIGCTISSGRHGIFSSGTSDAFIVTSNDGRNITNANKYNLSGLNNNESNNID